MTRTVRICAVVLKHRLCHRARYNLLHRRNVFVQILLHDEIESSAGSCISIPINLLSSCIRKQLWHFYFLFWRPAGHFTFMKSHTRLAAVMFICRTTATVAVCMYVQPPPPALDIDLNPSPGTRRWEVGTLVNGSEPMRNVQLRACISTLHITPSSK